MGKKFLVLAAVVIALGLGIIQPMSELPPGMAPVASELPPGMSPGI